MQLALAALRNSNKVQRVVNYERFCTALWIFNGLWLWISAIYPFFGISSRNHIMLGSNSWHWPYVYTSMQLLEQHSISSKFWAHHFRPYWKFRHHRFLGINLSYFIAISVEFDLNFFHITLRWKTRGLRRLYMQYEYDVISPNFHL